MRISYVSSQPFSRGVGYSWIQGKAMPIMPKGAFFAALMTFLSSCVIVFLGGLLAHDKLVEWGVVDASLGGTQSLSPLVLPEPAVPKEKPSAPPMENGDDPLKPSLDSN
jgi:hypothetical protein